MADAFGSDIESARPVAAPELERIAIGGIVAGFVIWLCLALGLSGLIAGLGDVASLAAELLPWLCLAIAATAVVMIVSRQPGGLSLGGNRLRRQAIGWIVFAAVLIVLNLAGGWLIAAMPFLGRLVEIIVEFCGSHGLFLGAAAALVAAAIAAVGSGGKVRHHQGAIERVFVINMNAKFASIPMVLVASFVFVGGTLWTVVYSFTNSRLLPRLQWAGLDQYERLWGTPKWIIAIQNLAIYGVCTLIFSLVIGFLLAALLDQKIRFENTFRTIFLYPFALSFVVTGLVWQWILNPDFGIQGVVRDMGFESFTFDPLYNPDIVIFGILIAGLWQGTGLVMCLMLAGLRGIDEDIWKASRVDGIPAWKTYIFIIIPMMRPVFITTFVVIASGIVRVYDLVVAQTSGGPGISSEVPAKYVYDAMLLSQNLGQGFAASTMMLLAVVIVIVPWAYFEFGRRRRNG